jgi:hypothetical protein
LLTRARQLDIDLEDVVALLRDRDAEMQPEGNR